MSYIDYEIDKLFTSVCYHREQIARFKRYAAGTGRNSIWTCKDGTQIRIKDMSLTHLKNALAMLKRKSPESNAIPYLKWEIAYREEYPKIVEALAEEERVIDECL